MDFAENPNQIFKNEAQILYYVKCTISLHNTVMHSRVKNPDNEEDEGTLTKIYIHHLSDDKSHNTDQVTVILTDIILSNDLNSTLVIGSDNCATQYKCAKVFASYRETVMEYVVDISRVYGVLQHGKGEVDSAGGGLK